MQRDFRRNALIARERHLSRTAAALLTEGLDPEDDEIGLFALELSIAKRKERKRHYAKRLRMLALTFSLQAICPAECLSRMRFEKRHIRLLASRITWPRVTLTGDVITERRRYVASKEEATCILLWRLSMPGRVCYMEEKFHRSSGALSELFYEALESLYESFRGLVEDFDVALPHLKSSARAYAECIASKAQNSVQHCVGFIDGTLTEIARPKGAAQRATYSGHKRFNGLKYQVITMPNGMIFNIFGPWEGRRHDMTLFRASGIGENLSNGLIINSQQYYLYADSGYVSRPYMLAPFSHQKNSIAEQLFNKRMSKVRV
jgi:nuclease HARBI1